eukprot:XP_011679893.1 PREDICTED: deleted in malignant brain tumors 1 protein-like [Strongylocentrotus purpuratus]
MRLIDGSSKAEGRVEVFYDGSWGTICDNGWDLRDARVVCRMLGFKGALDAPTSARFGQGSEDILLDLVGCDGTEGNLAESYPNSVGVRLVGGSNSSEGRVEIMYNGTWGTVCGDGWDLKDAKVVCRMLGFGDASAAPGSAKFGEGSDEILLSLVGCDGTENNLAECAHLGFGVHNCHHGEDAGVTCLLGVRLVGGANKYEGTVEILHEGSWGTVCDDLWDIDDAKVVCRQLGFDGALAALPTARFGQGSGEVLLEGVQCNGTEASLIDCNHKGIREHNCGHKEDAGVSCMRVAREDFTVNYDPVTSDVTKLPTSYRMSATDVLMPAADATTVVSSTTDGDGKFDLNLSQHMKKGEPHEYMDMNTVYETPDNENDYLDGYIIPTKDALLDDETALKVDPVRNDKSNKHEYIDMKTVYQTPSAGNDVDLDEYVLPCENSSHTDPSANGEKTNNQG